MEMISSSKINNEPLVSVIIPTYNRVTPLFRAVSSVLKQDYSNIEVIVIDDNSDSNVSELVNEIIVSFNDDRIKLIRPGYHVNGAHARNIGIIKSTGKYISFLDDDDFWLSNKLSLQVKFLENHQKKFDGVYCRSLHIKKGKITRVSSRNIHLPNPSNILSRDVRIPTCSLLVKSEGFREVFSFDETLKRHQEIQLLTHYSQNHKIYQIPDILLCITDDDIMNRPTESTIRLVKSALYKSVQNIFDNLHLKTQIKIMFYHEFEISWVIYRESRFRNASVILSLLRKHPLLFFKQLLSMISTKISNKLSAKMLLLDSKKKLTIYKHYHLKPD